MLNGFPLQLLQAALAIIGTSAIGVAGGIESMEDYYGRTLVTTNFPMAMQLNGLMFLPEKSSEFQKRHEYGHSIQQEKMGDRYLPAVAIGSIAGYFFTFIGQMDYDGYHDISTEAEADSLGGNR